MTDSLNKQLPKPGDKISHQFRGNAKPVVATVVSVDPQHMKVSVRFRGTVYKSLTAAARAANGNRPVNGWLFWGLRPWAPRRKCDAAPK
jgi:hypothetical protein